MVNVIKDTFVVVFACALQFRLMSDIFTPFATYCTGKPYSDVGRGTRPCGESASHKRETRRS